MYQHHANDTRNYFYGQQYKSTINILFNDVPEIVKSFTTLNYEGSLARITQHLQPAHPVLGGAWDDNEYFNLTSKDGWYIESSTTNLQSSGELEFKNKEDKYFTYMKGVTTTLANLDEQEFSVQGIGVLGEVAWGDPGDPEPDEPVVELGDYCLEITPMLYCGEVLGCMDSNADNYNPAATLDDGSCTYPDVEGCMDCGYLWELENDGCFCNDSTLCAGDGTAAGSQGGYNYNPNATVDDGSCCYRSGCMNDTMGMNPDMNGVCRDGTSISPWTANWCGGNNGWFVTNFDPLACFDAGCTLPEGCTDPNATNYDPFAVIDDGSCIDCTVYGCTDPNATNYDPTADCDNGTCEYECFYDPATSMDINDATTIGGTDGQILIHFPFIQPNVDVLLWSGPYIFDGAGNPLPTISGCGLQGCAFPTSYNDLLTAISGPTYACGDPDQACSVINGNASQTEWAIYLQGLTAGDYIVMLVNGANGCTFTHEFTIGEPVEMPIGCQEGNFPMPSTVVHYEQPNTAFSNALPTAQVYGTLYGVNHDYVGGAGGADEQCAHF